MYSDETSVLLDKRNMVIDLAAAPYEPEGLRAIHHLVYATAERFVWHRPAVELSRDAEQFAHGGLSAATLRENLRTKPGYRIFNANLLDFLIRHTADIPIEKADPNLEEPELAFFGTTYADHSDVQYVRTIRRVGGIWTERLLDLDSSCDRHFYAALWSENWLDKFC